MRKIFGLLKCIVIILILLSPIFWIYVSFVPFIKLLGSLLVIYFTIYVFSEGFDRAVKEIEDEKSTKITRFEYITDKGRQVVEYGEFEFQLQDDNRTLKVFKK